ncbi:MAG TPA: hypothetical protein VJS37_19575 [Terriglobales bacterium]|nr:hypothetical protein [Terriglobales bacterium]
MNRRICVGILFLLLPMAALADSQWNLQSSTLTYQVSHPLHHVEGVSHAARGKGQCKAGECEFLIAAPVKSFDSGDSNRDLHMLQATRGGEHPMVVVRTKCPESEIHTGTVDADLEVEFAGQTAHYKVPVSNESRRKRRPTERHDPGDTQRLQNRAPIVTDDANQK